MLTAAQLFERDIELAAQLPPLDAAYRLWVRKRELDALEKVPTTKYPTTTEMLDQKVFANAIKTALIEIYRAQMMEHKESTFRRLKKVHPNSNDLDLEETIKRAIKLDTVYSQIL